MINSNIKNLCSVILQIFIRIFSLIGFILLMWWLGAKGVAGVLIGFILLAILLATGNPFLLFIFDSFKKKEKVEYIKRKWLK